MDAWEVVDELDQVLRPVGFSRRRRTWNRRRNVIVDVVDLQTSKADDSVTVNVGVLDPEVHYLAWGETAPEFADEPRCTVRTRIGYLLGAADRWWSTDDPQAREEMAEAVSTVALSFLEETSSYAAMERVLREQAAYPPEVVYLALVIHKQDRYEEARRVLEEARVRMTEPWRERIGEIIARLVASPT